MSVGLMEKGSCLITALCIKQKLIKPATNIRYKIKREHF